MKKILKKIGVFLILSVLLVSLSAFPIFALESEIDSKIPAPPKYDKSQYGAIYFYNITTDTVLVSENVSEKMYTSTSAKILTGLIACEKLGKILDDEVIITEQMLVGVSGRTFKLSVGDKVSINDLLYASICGTYNDAAYVLANIISGSIEDFTILMNKKAAELGASDTEYINPTGYPDNSNMYTTALDVSKIALAAFNNPLYMEISSAFKYTVNDTEANIVSPIYNSNLLVCSNSTDKYFSKSFRGINSGFTGDDGGWCTVSIFDDEGVKYLYVALGGKEGSDGTIYSYSIANSLSKWATSTYGYVSIFEKGDEVEMTSISNTPFKVNNASLLCEEALSVYIPVGIDFGDRLRYETELDKKALRAPVEAGTVVGVVKVKLEDKVVGSVNLILKDSYEANFITTFINSIKDYLLGRAFIATLIFISVVLPITLIIVRKKSVTFTSKIKNRKNYLE